MANEIDEKLRALFYDAHDAMGLEKWIEKARLALTAPVATEQAQAVAAAKWCTHCRKDNHNDSECWSTRMIGAHDAHPAPIPMPTSFAWPKEISRLAASAEAAPAAMEADKDAKTWAAYVAGIVETYLNGGPSPEVREKAIAGIIERRLWALPPAATPAAPSAGAMRAAWVEEYCARIKAADDAAADRDYMLDSNDCMAVLRGTWTAPLANDCPPSPVQPKCRTCNGHGLVGGLLSGGGGYDSQDCSECKGGGAPVQQDASTSTSPKG